MVCTLYMTSFGLSWPGSFLVKCPLPGSHQKLCPTGSLLRTECSLSTTTRILGERFLETGYSAVNRVSELLPWRVTLPEE